MYEKLKSVKLSVQFETLLKEFDNWLIDQKSNDTDFQTQYPSLNQFIQENIDKKENLTEAEMHSVGLVLYRAAYCQLVENFSDLVGVLERLTGKKAPE